MVVLLQNICQIYIFVFKVKTNMCKPTDTNSKITLMEQQELIKELESRINLLENKVRYTQQVLEEILSKKIYSVKEFSALSTLKENTVRKYIKEGKILLAPRSKADREKARVNYQIPATELVRYRKISN